MLRLLFITGILLMVHWPSAGQPSGLQEKDAQYWLRLAGNIKMEESNYPEILKNYEHALALYHKTGNREKEAEVTIQIADIHFGQGKLNLAEIELLHALALYRSIGFKKLYNAYFLLSVISRYKGNFNKGLSYAMQCVKSMEATGDTTSAGLFYGELALVYQELGQTEKSIEWYRKALAKRESSNQYQVITYRTAGFLSQELIKQQKAKEALALMLRIEKKNPPQGVLENATLNQVLGHCYYALKQYGVAEKHYLDMIREYGGVEEEDEFTSIAHQDIGTFYLAQQQYHKAGGYLEKALAIAPGRTPLSRIKDIHLLLFKVDSAAGRYLAAIEHFRMHKILNDSIFNETKSRQIEELQIQYETEKKDQNILLLTRQGQLQQTRLLQSQTTRNMILGGTVMLALLLGLGYNRYRLKQKSNKKLEVQGKELRRLLSEKEWLLKEIHHRVKNNLHTVMGLLNIQSSFLKTGEALQAINSSQHRVQAMSLIHQKLYQSENLSTIYMPAYIHELVTYLKDSFDTRLRIRFNVEIESIELDISHAVPLGLILNEAITNSIKYAFPGNGDGQITIALQQILDDHYLLTIADDGIGLPADFDSQKQHSMGMSLMQGLSEDVRGSFSINSNKGTEIKINFVYNQAMRHDLNIIASDITTAIPLV